MFKYSPHYALFDVLKVYNTFVNVILIFYKIFLLYNRFFLSTTKKLIKAPFSLIPINTESEICKNDGCSLYSTFIILTDSLLPKLNYV